MSIAKKVPGLTAVLTEQGVSVNWVGGEPHSKPVLGTKTATPTHNEYIVFIPTEIKAFGFTEEDLNSVGFATAVTL